MHFKFDDVNGAFNNLVHNIFAEQVPTVHTPSRNGDVIQIVEPVTVTYLNPNNRVLFNSARDANPFFHLYEALWMLAGRNDVAPLKYYNKQMAVYSDDAETFNGAYGYRWRKASPEFDFERGEDAYVDQLEVITTHLKNNQSSRRAVLSMWNVEDDLLKIDAGLDVCCNLACTFQLRYVEPICVKQNSQGRCSSPNHVHNCPVVRKNIHPRCDYYLDMTVFNRSNDLIWGMLGANVVHFSFLLEYMAAKIGIQVGVYNQITANLHVYQNKWDPEPWLTDDAPNLYEQDAFNHFPLVQDPEVFDKELIEFVEINKNAQELTQYQQWQEPFLQNVAQPMCHAFHMHKARDYEAAFNWIDRVQAEDWKAVGEKWLAKRQARWENRNPMLERTPAKDDCE